MTENNRIGNVSTHSAWAGFQTLLAAVGRPDLDAYAQTLRETENGIKSRLERGWSRDAATLEKIEAARRERLASADPEDETWHTREEYLRRIRAETEVERLLGSSYKPPIERPPMPQPLPITTSITAFSLDAGVSIFSVAQELAAMDGPPRLALFNDTPFLVLEGDSIDAILTRYDSLRTLCQSAMAVEAWKVVFEYLFRAHPLTPRAYDGDAVRKQITELRGLKKGWFLGGGDPEEVGEVPTDVALSVAEALAVAYLTIRGPVYLYPTPKGGVSVEWGGGVDDVVVGPDGLTQTCEEKTR